MERMCVCRGPCTGRAAVRAIAVHVRLSVRGRTCSAGEGAFNLKRVLGGGQAWAAVRVGAPELCAGCSLAEGGVLEAGEVLRMSVVCGCSLGPEKWRWVCHCASTCAKIPGHATPSRPTLILSPGQLGCLPARSLGRESQEEAQGGDGDSPASKSAAPPDQAVILSQTTPASPQLLPRTCQAPRRRRGVYRQANEEGHPQETRRPEKRARSVGFERRRGRSLSPAQASHPSSSQGTASWLFAMTHKKHPWSPSTRPQALAGEAGPGAPQSAREQHSPGSLCAALRPAPARYCTRRHRPFTPVLAHTLVLGGGSG